ncbi:MAG TPA: YfiR family protein [Polyangiaceae bacterium]|nr:YfiR family protein [Polyangiaceae bacterium]
MKAEFIERFTHFVDWPDSAFASASSAFVVCVWGRGPLAAQLEQVVTRAPIKGRAVRVLHVESRERIPPCHILYVATHEPTVVRDIVASTRGKPILSIGDQPGLAEEGLLINLVLDQEGFVRFEINLDVARISGLKISAKLMRLARRVGTRR